MPKGITNNETPDLVVRMEEGAYVEGKPKEVLNTLQIIKSFQTEYPEIAQQFYSLRDRKNYIESFDSAIVNKRLSEERRIISEAGEAGDTWKFQSRLEKKRSPEVKRLIVEATQLHAEFLGEYYLRVIAPDKLEEGFSAIFGELEIPDTWVSGINQAITELRATPLKLIGNNKAGIFDIDTQMALFSRQIPLDKIPNEVVDSVNALYDPRFLEMGSHTKLKIVEYVVGRVVGDMSQEEARPYMYGGASHGAFITFNEMRTGSITPQRGIKLHISADWQDPKIFQILQLVKYTCGKSIEWKLLHYREPGKDIQASRKLITIYPPVDHPETYSFGEPASNFENAFKLAAQLDTACMSGSLGISRVGTASGELGVGNSKRVALRYGEMAVDDVNTTEYGDSWHDIRGDPLNLPDGVTAETIENVAQRHGVTLNKE